MSDEGLFREGAQLVRKDVLGRTLTIKQLSLREEMNLIAAAGAERSENRKWMMYATLLACVRDIDGIPAPPYANMRGIESMITKVGAEGVAVVAEVIATEAASLDSDEGDQAALVAASPVDEVMATAKN